MKWGSAMEKRLYLVGGTMGVGKTTVCQILKRELRNSVFLDGDWCWDADPFQVTEETQRMVLDNICHLLGNFLACSAYENVIFGWVMHQQAIIDTILRNLDLHACRIFSLSLVCTREALERRLRGDIAQGLRTEDVVARSVARLPLYNALATIKIDTSALTPEQIARRIASLS